MRLTSRWLMAGTVAFSSSAHNRRASGGGAARQPSPQVFLAAPPPDPLRTTPVRQAQGRLFLPLSCPRWLLFALHKLLLARLSRRRENGGCLLLKERDE